MKSEPCRRSVKAFGAVSRKRDPRFHFQFSERFNANTFLTFIKRLTKNDGRKVFLVLDNVGYHHAKLVREWTQANSNRIELHFLPAYSPDLNPIEILWRQTRRSATHNRHFDTLQSLQHRLFRRFNRHQGNPAYLRGIVGMRCA